MPAASAAAPSCRDRKRPSALEIRRADFSFGEGSASRRRSRAGRAVLSSTGMTESASILELLMRGGAVGAFAGLAIVCARGRPNPVRITAFLFCLSAAAHTLTQYPPILSAVGPFWRPIWAFSVMGAGLFWAFAIHLFGDRFQLDVFRFLPAGALLFLGLVASWSENPGANAWWILHNAVGAMLLGHVLFIVWSGWRHDLVDTRRRLRGPILALGALYAIIVVAVQIGELVWRPADALSPIAAAALFLLGLASLGALLQADADLFAPPITVAVDASEARAATPLPMSAENARYAARLTTLMSEDRVYRQEGLTIGDLAQRVGLPEHRLRRLINQQLGFRNFSAFLNEQRLGEAKQALADPAQREVPISTIALDAGFQSLGPFNRAFKAMTGMTPTAYRANSLAASGSGRSGAARETA